MRELRVTPSNVVQTELGTRPCGNSIGRLLRSKRELRAIPSNVVGTQLEIRPYDSSIGKLLTINENAIIYSFERETTRAWDQVMR